MLYNVILVYAVQQHESAISSVQFSCSVVSDSLRPHESQHAISHMYIHIPSLLDFLCCGLCLVAQSCPTLCDPMDCSLPGSSVHGEFSRQEYWSGLPHPPPGDLPNPGIEPKYATMQRDSLSSELTGKFSEGGVKRGSEQHPKSSGLTQPSSWELESEPSHGYALCILSLVEGGSCILLGYTEYGKSNMIFKTYLNIRVSSKH